MSAATARRPGAFTCPPAGSVLEAASKAFEKACAKPWAPDSASIRRTVVAALARDGMPADLQGKWLDGLIDSQVEVVSMTIGVLQASLRKRRRRSGPDPLCAAFGTMALIRARSAGYPINEALTKAATAIGPGVTVDELRAAASWWFSLLEVSSPQERAAMIASLDVLKHELPPPLAGEDTMFLEISDREFYAVAGILDEMRGA